MTVIIPPERKKIIAGVAVVLVVALGIWAIFGSGSRKPQGPAAPTVTTSMPAKQAVTDWREFTGRFTAVEYVEVRARVGGYLDQIHFTDGQMVKKGDVLFTIDPRPFEIALASAKARLESAAASKVFAARQLNRAGELRGKDYVAQSTLDQRQQESQGASSGVDTARAAVRDAELNLEFSKVVAPVSGRISNHQVSVGNLIAGTGSGTTTLLTTIVSLDPLHFVFDMSEADYYAFLRSNPGAAKGASGMGTVAELRLADEAKWTRQGKLDFLDNQIDRGAGTIRARVVLPNADNSIAPGSFGRIRLAMSAPYEALLIPDESVVTDQARKIVMTVTADGTVVPKPVVLGPLVDGLRVVREGLSADDQVIINGLMRARPGAKVTPQPGQIGKGQAGNG